MFLNFRNKKLWITLAVFGLSFAFRLILLFNYYVQERHSFTGFYGSTAIGIYSGEGATYNYEEISSISSTKTNLSGDFLQFKSNENRQPWLYSLPGPPYTIAYLWKVFPLYNFLSYIFLQIILDSLATTIFFIVFYKDLPKMVLVISLVYLIFNPLTISKTLNVSYDFWAIFCVLINIGGIYYAISNKKNEWLLFLLGLVTAWTLWFRDIINFLPFFIVFGLIIYFLKNKLPVKRILFKVFIYLLPIIVSLATLSLYRYNNTGSLRPTQTFFWHAFFCAIGQFDNPYGITSTDQSVWALGHKLNNDISLNFYDQIKYGDTPTNIYEETLKKEGINFIKTYPHLFLRNMVIRSFMMISPFLFSKSKSSISQLFNNVFIKIFGILMVILWLIGLYHLINTNNRIIFVIVPIFLYFLLIFSWFYLNGRVLLCFGIINLFMYVYGILYLFNKILPNRYKQ